MLINLYAGSKFMCICWSCLVIGIDVKGFVDSCNFYVRIACRFSYDLEVSFFRLLFSIAFVRVSHGRLFCFVFSIVISCWSICTQYVSS